MTRRSVTMVMAGVIALVAAGCAVVPSYPSASRTFEGFPVISSVPDHPAGIVFAFHGTGGSVGFATKLETVDMLNHLTAAGYGFVATESTDRVSKQWDTSSLSLTANPDLARLSDLYASLRADGTITAETPVYAIGMSRGAGFAAVFAQAFENAGYPVAAIAPSHGQIPFAVRALGGLTVPAFFALGANDPIVDNTQVIGQVDDLVAHGVAAQYVVEPESPLRSGRFLRVPNVDGPTADAVFSALVRAGLYDAAGHRLVDPATVEAALPTLAYPANVTAEQKQALRDEVDVVLAVHEYSATYADQTVAFFRAHT